MDAGQINRMLYQHFCNYDYRLHNSFVYQWESDFFAVSGSSYCVEVEVKVSRGDFFRDFDKHKHRLFTALVNKRSHYTTSSETKGDFICAYYNGILHNYDDGTEGYSGRNFLNRWGVTHNGKYGYWVNDTDHVYLRRHLVEIHAAASRVYFHEVSKQLCPNQLYFACPENLIKIEEIPPYAGLLYCGKDGIDMIRKAPYLHKVKQNMTGVLLQKFYNLWQYKTDLDKKIEVTGQYNLFNK